MELTIMAWSRNRKKYLNDSKNPSRMFSSGTLIRTRYYPGVVDLLAMTDRTTSGWPRLEIAEADRNVPMRLGFPHGSNERKMSIVVNNMVFSSTSTSEASSVMQFKRDANLSWVKLDGSVVQLLINNTTLSAWPSPSTPILVSLADLSDEARSRVLIKAMKPEYSFGEPIAEIKKTVQMIRNPLGALRRMANSFFRKTSIASNSARTRRQYLRAFGSTYAEYQFGMAPLMRTVQDALDANVDWATHDFLGRTHKKIKGGATSTATSTALSAGAAFKFPAPISQDSIFCSRSSILTIDRTVIAGLHKAVPDTVSKQEYLGLSARDIPELAWDLFPYSFLIDRLVNVKSWIRTSNSLLGGSINFSGGWVTTRQTTRLSRRFTGFTRNASFATNPDSSPSLSDVEFLYERNKWDPSTTEVTLPKSGSGLLSSLSSTADLVAVILTRLKP